MKSASRSFDPRPGSQGRTKDAWTAFWTDPGQSRCVAGAPEIWQALNHHWSSVAKSLTPDTRVLDLGCGAGAVARLLLAARSDVQITGVDFARIPLTLHPNFELLSETPMESLPFGAKCFQAVVSQFGFEYSQCGETARELALVLAPGARLSFLVHHAESSIVITNRSRLKALVAFLGLPMRAAFCSGEGVAFNGHLSALRAQHPHDTLIAELASCLPSRLGRTPREKAALWDSIEDALAPERCLAESLDSHCVAPARLQEWLEPLHGLCELQPVAVLREPDGAPIGWRVQGVRRS
jgi:ubiquinone/menaquinone biosynthesis C-methylase UbiE